MYDTRQIANLPWPHHAPTGAQTVTALVILPPTRSIQLSPVQLPRRPCPTGTQSVAEVFLSVLSPGSTTQTIVCIIEWVSHLPSKIASPLNLSLSLHDSSRSPWWSCWVWCMVLWQKPSSFRTAGPDWQLTDCPHSLLQHLRCTSLWNPAQFEATYTLVGQANFGEGFKSLGSGNLVSSCQNGSIFPSWLSFSRNRFPPLKFRQLYPRQVNNYLCHLCVTSKTTPVVSGTSTLRALIDEWRCLKNLSALGVQHFGHADTSAVKMKMYVRRYIDIRLYMWSASGAADPEGVENLAHDKKPFTTRKQTSICSSVPVCFRAPLIIDRGCTVWFITAADCHPDRVLCLCGFAALPLCQKQPDDITAGTSVFHVVVEKYV